MFEGKYDAKYSMNKFDACANYGGRFLTFRGLFFYWMIQLEIIFIDKYMYLLCCILLKVIKIDSKKVQIPGKLQKCQKHAHWTPKSAPLK